MLRSSLPEKQIQGNALEFHLRAFATSLLESGYQERTIQDTLYLLTAFGWWFGRRRRAIAHIDERLVDALVRHRRRMRRADLGTLQQFLDHLRRRDVIPPRKLVPDQSPLAGILNAYEQYLRSERGLVSSTILGYQSYARKFLVERFRKEPLVLKEIKASDVSDFVLRHCRRLSVKRAQLLTTAFR